MKKVNKTLYIRREDYTKLEQNNVCPDIYTEKEISHEETTAFYEIKCTFKFPEKKIEITESQLRNTLENKLGNIPNIGHRIEEVIEVLSLYEKV